MTIRSFFLGLAVVAGIAQAADAASVFRYDIDLRYTGTVFTDVQIGPHDEDLSPFSVQHLALEGNPYGVTGTYGHLAPGDTVTFAAKVVYPDPPYGWTTSFHNGGATMSCSLAGRDCSDATETYPGTEFQIFSWDTSEIYGSTTVGDVFRHQFWGPLVPTQTTAYGYFHSWFETARFEVVAVNHAAPVPAPLPVSAALLPLGIGALAMMRRRRRCGCRLG